MQQRAPFQDGESSSSFSMLWDYLAGGTRTDTSGSEHVPQDHISETTSLLAGTSNRSKATTFRVEEDMINESPDCIRRCQDQLDWELAAIVIKPAYNYAVQQSRGYAQSLRLMFLRADRFDVRKAAIRLVTFFEAKLQLFGSEVLCRRIQQSDLDYEDMISLRSGCFQLLPIRDKANRAVFCYYPKHHNYTKADTMVRL
jgi:hypothetical protein